MISYRKLAMRVLGHPLRVPTNTPRPASHRVTALALTAAMVAGMAAPAYAGTYYIGDGDITITKDESGTYVKQGNNSSNDGKGDKDNTDIVIKGGKRSEDTTAPGGSSSEGGTSATSAAKSASATLKVEDSENEDKDMVYPGDTKGSDSSDGGGEENETQSTEKDQTGDTTDGKNTGAGSSDPESKGSEGGNLRLRRNLRLWGQRHQSGRYSHHRRREKRPQRRRGKRPQARRHSHPCRRHGKHREQPLCARKPVHVHRCIPQCRQLQ